MNELIKGQPFTILFNYEGMCAPVEVVWNGRMCNLSDVIHYEVERVTPSRNPDAKNSYLLSGEFIKTSQPEWEDAEVATL